MSWLTRVRNAIASVTQKETAENLWHKCPSCAQMIFTKEFEENLSVCPSCEHHGRIGAKKRFTQIFDEGHYTLLPSPRARCHAWSWHRARERGRRAACDVA